MTKAARRTFLPVVLLGLASSALAAVAGNQAWVRGTPADGPADTGYDATMSLDLELEMPLAWAVSLVLLAAWGVLLVTRAGARRVVAAVALVAALGLVVTIGVAAVSLPDALREDFTRVGAPPPQTSLTLWFAIAALSALLAVVAGGLAVRHAATWPEMGRRYDAPTGGHVEPDASGDDLWKAIEQGRDPTEDPAP